MKMKKTTKEKKRYILFEIKVEGKPEISEKEIIKTVLDSQKHLFGVSSLADAKIEFILCDYPNAVVRCNNSALENVKAAIRTVFKIIRVSGTIKGLNR